MPIRNGNGSLKLVLKVIGLVISCLAMLGVVGAAFGLVKTDTVANRKDINAGQRERDQDRKNFKAHLLRMEKERNRRFDRLDLEQRELRQDVKDIARRLPRPE